jgi:menaquinone-dependent protoporphyrinogen oxidase
MEPRKLLVVYATTDGQTEKIARRITDVAASQPLVESAAFDVRTVAPAAITSCDAVVLAASVRFGRHQRAMLRFVRKHRQFLASKRTAFVSVSGASASPSGREVAKEYVAAFLRKAGWFPDVVELVAGATLFTRYNPLLRFIMRRIAASRGLDRDTRRDFEYTDWNRVDQFARSFVSQGTAKVA